MVIIVMGVSGAGKTTIGKLLARELGWRFIDADDLHSAENKRKMAAGIALRDEDRAPWLAGVRDRIARCLAENSSAVVACSALKQAYRDQIVIDPGQVRMAYLKGSRELIASRVAARGEHFMSRSLLDSQFETLEEPRCAIAVDVSATPGAVVRTIRERVGI